MSAHRFCRPSLQFPGRGVWLAALGGMLSLCVTVLPGCGCGNTTAPAAPDSIPTQAAPAEDPAPIIGNAERDRVTLTREIARTGSHSLKVTVTLGYEGAQPVTALGVVEEIPEGWRLEELGGGNARPQVAPHPGEQENLEFVWITVPAFPFSFTYTLQRDSTVPAPSPAQLVRGRAVYRRLGGEERSADTETPVPPATGR